MDVSSFEKLEVFSKISIIRSGSTHEGTLGKGVVMLLEGIEELGSLNKAAKKLGMAYSKAWRIVKETEQGFGFDLIVRDGARGSTLTDEGRVLVRIYRQIQRESSEFANERFREEIGKLSDDRTSDDDGSGESGPDAGWTPDT